MGRIICPSMMCANYNLLKEEVQNLDVAGIDIFHNDIMDGRFVPNFAMGLHDLDCIRRNTNKLIDVHLMIEEPERYIDLFIKTGVDIIYIHPEADKHPARTLGRIKDAGRFAGIAINPGTSVEMIYELLSLADYILVMTVNPGFARQKYLDFVNAKIKKLIELKKEYDFKLMVDGAISREKINLLSSWGVDGFIVGTSALFGKNQGYDKIVSEIKEVTLSN